MRDGQLELSDVERSPRRRRVQPYTWSIPRETDRPRLALTARPPAGLSGTPTTAATFTFTVAVTDEAGTQTTEPGSITIS